MLRDWLRWLWFNEDGFFGIGMGPSKAQEREAGMEGALANFATSTGESDILASDKFFKAILSGDPAAIAQVMGPEFSAINKQSQEQKKTASEFGNRGGGTNAAMQMTGESARSSIDQLLASLTGSAAGELGAGGRSLLSTGSSAHGEAFDMASVIQKLKSAKIGDIFKSISDVATGVFSGMSGMGKKPAFPGMTGADVSGSFGGPSKAPTTTSNLDWTLSE
jgi:hypothetical protein